MNPYMQIRHKRPGKFRVGDRVRMRYWFPDLIGEITEDRGSIGLNGRRLYGVKVQIDDWKEMTAELPDEDLRVVRRSPKGKP